MRKKVDELLKKHNITSQEQFCELLLEAIAHRESKTIETLAGYLPVLRGIGCQSNQHVNESMCDQFCGDNARAAASSLSNFSQMTFATEMVAEQIQPEEVPEKKKAEYSPGEDWP